MTEQRSLDRSTVARLVLTGAAVFCIAATQACDGEMVTVGLPPGVTQTSARIQAGDVYAGYVERFRFASGSDRVSLTFASPTTGTLWLGAAPDGTEPPVDPTTNWPAWMDPSQGFDMATRAERILFAMHDVSYDDTRLRFTIDLGETWIAWCAAQHSIPQYPSVDGVEQTYSCTPPNSIAEIQGTSSKCAAYDRIDDFSPNAPRPMMIAPLDCGHIMMCHPVVGVCSCDASGCGPRLGVNELHFDMRLDGGKGDGSAELGNIRLVKQ